MLNRDKDRLKANLSFLFTKFVLSNAKLSDGIQHKRSGLWKLND